MILKVAQMLLKNDLHLKFAFLILILLASLAQGAINENLAIGMVYQWFSLFDRNASSDQFLPFILNDGLEMKFPERTLRSHADFNDWYSGIQKTIKSAGHKLSNVEFKQVDLVESEISLNVVWSAETFKGEKIVLKVHQIWRIIEATKDKPIIKKLEVQVIPDK